MTKIENNLPEYNGNQQPTAAYNFGNARRYAALNVIVMIAGNTKPGSRCVLALGSDHCYELLKSVVRAYEAPIMCAVVVQCTGT